jgi:hypothetical protein
MTSIPEIKLELEEMSHRIVAMKAVIRKHSKSPNTLVDVLPVLTQLDTAKTILAKLAMDLKVS